MPLGGGRVRSPHAFRLSNRFGVGARLRLVIGEKSYIREVGAGSSYCSQNAVGEELFGLGRAEKVDTLEVTWPGGVVRRLTDLAANQTVVVREIENRKLKIEN